MLYQYKNFRTREIIHKREKNELNMLFKFITLLIIINLILISVFCSEKNKFKKYKNNYASNNMLAENNDKRLKDKEIIKRRELLGFINDRELCSLCENINYSNDSLEIQGFSKDIDEVYERVKKHDYVKQCEIEGDCSKFDLKLVLK